MGITHRWEGTKLYVTSDSGTSACDLKGDTGAIGARGVQGVPGVPGTVAFESLTEEQKQQLRGEQSLFITLSGIQEVERNKSYTATSSHYASSILNYVNSGGMAYVCFTLGTTYTLSYTHSPANNTVVFSGCESNRITTVTINNDVATINVSNISELEGVVKYDNEQSLTDEEKAQARENIDAISEKDVRTITDSATYFLENNDFVGTGEGKLNVLSGNYTISDFALASIVTSDGKVTEDLSRYLKYLTSPLIPIIGGKTYGVLMTTYVDSLQPGALSPVNDGYGLYGSSGEIISKISIEKLNNNIVLIDTPLDAKYIRFTIRIRANIDFPDVESGTPQYNEAIAEFNKWVMFPDMDSSATPDDFKIIEPSGNGEISEILRADGSQLALCDEKVRESLPLFGKTIVNFGDSIFGNKRPPNDISSMIAKYTGANVINCAFGGCRMAQHTGHWDAFSMYRLAYSVANNDWALQDEAILHEDRTSYAEVPLANLKAIDFSKVDVITIGYCTNDFGGNIELEDNEENLYDCSTFGGAFRYSLEQILTAYPHIRIVTLGAIFRTYLDSNKEVETLLVVYECHLPLFFCEIIQCTF